MNSANILSTLVPCFADLCKRTLVSHPCDAGMIAVSRSPGTADVMGGIAEDSGSLVLTTSLALAAATSLWHVGGDHVHLLRIEDETLSSGEEIGNGSPLESRLPLSRLNPQAGTAEQLIAACRDSGVAWAAPACLTLRQAVADGVVSRLDRGLVVLTHSQFPADVDLGKQWVEASATVECLCRLHNLKIDRLRKSRICADALLPLTGLHNLRTPMTALSAPPDGGLLQLRFHPQVLCQPLEMPAGILIRAVGTQLSRPTTPQRLMDTRLCAEMGRRMILELQQQDGVRLDPATARLAAITPAEYVERYRDRLPSKITGKAFATRFGTIRGLGAEPAPAGTYKIRSRAEHCIYENRRVHEFATCIARARRTNSPEPLIAAGELMYASHWSHSQRCGIGGVEADQLVTAIRRFGPEAGLFGAKVTAGGAGGELVVLMRADDRAKAALSEAVGQIQATTRRPVHTFSGPLPGAEFFHPPELAKLETVAAG